jgi:hypothetical protein
MKTNFINSTFASLTFLLIAGCASMTQAPGPSTPPSATVRIQEWSAAYYAQAEAGKGTSIITAGGTISPSLVAALVARALKRSLPLVRSIT